MLVPAEFRFPKAPRFIVFDGVNGAGKSTLIASLKEALNTRGQNVTVTREPGATTLGKAIRPILLEKRTEPISSRAEVFLFSADRAQHVDFLLRPALRAGDTVLCDRYFYSTLAFQGYGRELPLRQLELISEIAIDGLLPDLVILLDLDPEEGLRRIKAAKGGVLAESLSKGPLDPARENDALEEEGLAFQNRMRHGFLELARNRPEPFLVLDASAHPRVLFEKSLALLSAAGEP
jgi:dTMP kinase